MSNNSLYSEPRAWNQPIKVRSSLAEHVHWLFHSYSADLNFMLIKLTQHATDQNTHKQKRFNKHDQIEHALCKSKQRPEHHSPEHCMRMHTMESSIVLEELLPKVSTPVIVPADICLKQVPARPQTAVIAGRVKNGIKTENDDDCLRAYLWLARDRLVTTRQRAPQAVLAPDHRQCNVEVMCDKHLESLLTRLQLDAVNLTQDRQHIERRL